MQSADESLMIALVINNLNQRLLLVSFLGLLNKSIKLLVYFFKSFDHAHTLVLKLFKIVILRFVFLQLSVKFKSSVFMANWHWR